MHPISLIFLGLCAFLLGIWLVRYLERRRLTSADVFPAKSPISPPNTPRGRSSTTLSHRTSMSAARAMPMAQLEDEVQQLLAQNRKIEAIKRVREHTGWDLKQAKDYVEQLPSRPEMGTLAPDIEAAARKLLAENQKIAAIKLIRNHTGWNLKRTKEFVDDL
jgi:ribosomal protein L7/L12